MLTVYVVAAIAQPLSNLLTADYGRLILGRGRLTQHPRARLRLAKLEQQRDSNFQASRCSCVPAFAAGVVPKQRPS